MRVKKEKRLSAFLIDILVVSLFLMFTNHFIKESNVVETINNNITIINEQVINHDISFTTYIKEFGENVYKLDYERVIQNGFNILITILYFILVPIITKGYTLGMYILGIKIKGNLSIKSLLLRNIITTGFLYSILSFIAVYILNGMTYFIVLTILGFIQILLVILSTFMIIYRKDFKGIQDIISDTEIVSDKEVKK